MYEHQISVLLERIGSNVCYMGYGYCLTGLEHMLILRNQHFRPTKDIYPVIAREHHTTISNVERNIRTMINSCWYDGNRELIQRICHRKYKPSNGAFLAGLYAQLYRQITLAEEAERQAAATATSVEK